ncbi:pseudaminic acid biosynthesis-associated methylase [bacterium]|nr:MAG: pseudaminic acid biosynthesis-associated methylase [bacterium]
MAEPHYETVQEQFWSGAFGTEYGTRNSSEALQASSRVFFSNVLGTAFDVTSILELGANIGLNLVALRQLVPHAELAAVEINAAAAGELRKLPGVEVYQQSVLEFAPRRRWDLVFTKGVLIHVAPEKLPIVYDLMAASSARYVCVCEYYNPTPVSIPYRGHQDVLFKRDFAGELLDRHPELELVNYGFAYHRDAKSPQDDLTWFLLEKRGRAGA